MLRRSFLGSAAMAMAAERRPNVVFVLVDDLRWDELRCTGHPFAETPHADRLAKEGGLFRNAFATTPLCSPSRASFLTSTYAHTHAVTDNVARDALSHKLDTWPRRLHEAGYRTAFIGKWHMGNDDSPRPGFDKWVSFRGQGVCNDPVLNVDGRSGQTEGYVTDLLTDHAVEFIRKEAGRPFCLYLAHKAIHPNIVQRDDGSIVPVAGSEAEQFIAAPRHKHLYGGKPLPRRPNYGVVPKDKPALATAPAGVHTLDSTTGTDDATIYNRLRMAKAVDESLGRLLEALEKAGQLDRTMVVFTSDHGYFYGEHCLGPERRLAYEETIRIPLLVRYPARFPAGVRPEKMVLSVDVGATVLDLAGVKRPAPCHGHSLLAGGRERDAILVEYFSDTVFPRVHKMGYSAVRTKRWKYIRYRDREGADELYDLASDPYEMKNRIGDSGVPLAALRKRLQELLTETGANLPLH